MLLNILMQEWVTYFMCYIWGKWTLNNYLKGIIVEGNRRMILIRYTNSRILTSMAILLNF